MDWKPRSANLTILLDDIFSAAKGWEYSSLDVPLQRHIGTDGGPYYEITIDGIVLTVYEQDHWVTGTNRTAPPHRLVIGTKFTNITISDHIAFLRDNFALRSLPSYSLDEGGALNLTAAFPIGVEFPLDLARRQMMVCIGLIAEQAAENLQHWNSTPATKPFAWGTAGKVATVAGKFVGALFDL